MIVLFFIPKVPSMTMMELAKAMAPKCKIKITGISPGEKLHESLLTNDESRHSVEFKDKFIILPEHSSWNSKNYMGGKKLPDGYLYSSDNNKEWLTSKQLLKLI